MGIVPWQLLIVGAVVTVVRPQTTVNVAVQTEPPIATPLISSTYIDLVCDPDTGSNGVSNIMFTWTGPDGVISNGPDYTITDQADSSTLRIEELSVDRDNAAYICSVSGNVSGNNSLTLSVVALQNTNFEIMVSIPGIPTAGDNFTITCIVTGPERLVITPQLDWEVEVDGMSPEPVADAEAAIGVPTIGNTVPTEIANFSRTLSFTKIRTSQARRYSCKVFISGVISQSGFGDLHVQIPPPVVTVRVDPAVDPIYSSTAINLTCTAVLAEEVNTTTMAVATWTGPTGGTNGVICQQPIVSPICVVEAVSVGERMFESTLVFYPVDFKKDVGVHTCDMTISSNTMFAIEDTVIEAANNVGNISVTVAELPEDVPSVAVAASGSTEVGQSLNLSCSVTLLERMVVSPGVDYNITWIKMDSVSQGVIGKDINITTETVTGDVTTTVTLIFDPLRFEDRGTYICMADLNVTRTLEGGEESEEVKVIVDFPPVDVEVTADNEDTLYAGTNLTLTCFADLDENLVDIPVVLNTSWTKSNVPVIINSTYSEEQPSLVNMNLLTYAATLSFSPLDDQFDSTDSSDMGDSGAYQCDLTVMSDVGDSFVNAAYASDTSDSINVEPLPTPDVEIITDGAMTIGEPLNLTCVVNVVPNLIVPPEIEWVKLASSKSVPANDISVDPLRDENNSTLRFTSLNSSDAGQYTCRASVSNESLDVLESPVTGYNTQNIILQIPSVVVSLSQSREGQEQHAGSNLTLTADISVHSNVDTLHIVSPVWDRNGNPLSSDERVSILNVSDVTGVNQYRTEIVFSSLSSTFDSGMYNCTVQVNSDSAYAYITSTSATGSATIDVNDPGIELDADMVDEFAAVPTTCNYSEVFVGLNLTCYASKPVEVLPELRVKWLRNDNEVMGEVQYTADNTVATTVTLDSAEFIDTNYTCSAELNIPNSPDIDSSRVYEVVFKGSASQIFQLKLVGLSISQCENLTLQPSILSLVRSNVTEGIRSLCQCEFQERLIYQSALFCNEPDSAVFRAMIFSSAVYSDVAGLVELIKEWVQDGSSISIDDGDVMFDLEFLATDSSLSSLECAEPSLSPTPTESAEPILIVVVGAAIGVVVMVLLVISIVLIIACIKAKSKRKLGSPSRNGVSAIGFTSTFAEPPKVVDSQDNFEMDAKVDLSNGGNEVKGEVSSNQSHPDQSDPVVNQYNSLGREKCMFAEPIKLEETPAFDDNFAKSTTTEESNTAASTTNNHE